MVIACALYVHVHTYVGEEDAIEIYTPERPYTFYTRSKAQKRLWLNKLRDTIYHYLLKKGKCERNQNCATGTYMYVCVLLGERSEPHPIVVKK